MLNKFGTLTSLLDSFHKLAGIEPIFDRYVEPIVACPVKSVDGIFTPYVHKALTITINALQNVALHLQVTTKIKLLNQVTYASI